MGTAVRVLVLTAPVAEGHLAAARTLSEDIRRANPSTQVTVCDVLPALRRPLRWLLNDAYRWQLGAAPWLFGMLFAALRHSRALRALCRAALSLAGSRALLRLLVRHPADVIVSTWPAATMILGCLRLRGKVRVPVCATITDFAGLELWAHRGIDLHLVMHDSLVPIVERVAGRGSAHVVSPLVSSPFRTHGSAAQARRVLGLPMDTTIVVVSGGGWAVGDLEGAVRAALDIGAFVVCLAGRDDTTRVRLQKTFAGELHVAVLGFTDQMSDLLAAADVLVHSTGGVTCLEALACGCPIVAYGAPPGHAPLLAQEMSALGLAAYARSAAELRAAMIAAVTKPRIFLTQGVDAASLVLAVAPRVAVRLRARLARTAASACAISVALFALLASDATYPLVAKAHVMPESTSLSRSRHSVALVVRGQKRDLLELALVARGNHLQASVAASDRLTTQDVATLRAARLDPIPELRTGGVASWFEARDQLHSQIVQYGLHSSFYYLAPREGFTMGDYLIAWHLGGTPVQAGADLLAGGHDAGSVHPGEVVVATLGSKSGRDLQHVLAAIRDLERAGLAVFSVQELASGRPLF
jgi:UDP-N-acetylglucosamine:LPS N-acetylglucosamine transferase